MARASFPCLADLKFFQEKRTPAWAESINKTPKDQNLIDFCVNEHAGIRLARGERSAHNLLEILAWLRNCGLDLERELLKISKNPECASDPGKRAAFARKWARRLARAYG